ncbi:MAG: response regulator [Methanolinea sp.]
MDDEEGIREIVKIYLARLGYRAEVVADGEAARESYERALRESDPFAVVILDLSVKSGPDGIETLRLLKAIDPGVRAIITTGFTDDPIVSRYRELGFSAVVPKPFQIHRLDEAIRAVLSGDSPA